MAETARRKPDMPGTHRINREVTAMDDWLRDVTPRNVTDTLGRECTVIAEGVTPSGVTIRIMGDAIVRDPEERRRVDARIRAAIDRININQADRANQA